ncbi:hypothetical protein NDU88_003143 [Pleurodeles waltl]|uniref:Uncharacterized protein n=1 Tax=Pleurodeles waltl TaxID=8319 RepID=A0AAV7UCJ0_PLEWA|nr:hypothetical protein NDU88_003143 [Pleurodeles waltl]
MTVKATAAVCQSLLTGSEGAEPLPVVAGSICISLPVGGTVGRSTGVISVGNLRDAGQLKRMPCEEERCARRRVEVNVRRGFNGRQQQAAGGTWSAHRE